MCEYDQNTLFKILDELIKWENVWLKNQNEDGYIAVLKILH